MPDALWSSFVRVLRGLTDRAGGKKVSGSFNIAAQEDLEALKACLDGKEDTNILIEDVDSQQLAIGQQVRISVAPRLGFGLIAEDLDELLRGPRSVRFKAHKFFLLKEGIEGNAPVADDHPVARYRATLDLIASLRKSAAFLDSDEPALIFISDGKFEVPIEYDVEDLQKTDLAAVKGVASALPEGAHAQEYASILAEAVISTTKSIKPSDRFSFLLRHVAELKSSSENGYTLFAAGFTYEKIRDEIEGAKVEFSSKIHKVFSDIQNQLLGIPVATVIVATQMKPHQVVSAEFWVSIAVLIGSAVFALLMHFLLRNQRYTLEVVGIEIKRQKAKLEKEHAAIAPNFVDTFRSLAKRYQTQFIVLWLIDAIVVLGLLMSLFFFYQLSEPAHRWIDGYMTGVWTSVRGP